MKEKYPIGHVYGLPTESQDKEKQPMADRRLADEPLACVYGPPPVYNNPKNYADPKKNKLKTLLSKLFRK